MATVKVLRFVCFHILDADVSNKVVVVIKCCSSVPVHMYTPHGVLHQVEQLTRLIV